MVMVGVPARHSVFLSLALTCICIKAVLSLFPLYPGGKQRVRG